jgi:hypothetical protein
MDIETEDKISALKKITLSLEAGTTDHSMDLSPQPLLFEFIFGLGTGGLTPFEFQLAGKTPGDEIRLHLKRQEIPQVFQHLIIPPLNIPEHWESFYLRVRVIKMIPADQREVVKALADIANCDDHCCGH